MPADRSRARSPRLGIDADDSQLTWTEPLEPLSLSSVSPSSFLPTAATGISFTSTITPTNYNYVPTPSKSAKKHALADPDVGPGEVMEPSTIIFQVNDKQVPPRKASSSSSPGSPIRKRSHPYANTTDSQPATHIPRPPNAFILFRSSFIRSQQISTEIETSHSTLSKIIGLTWKNLPADEKKVWHDRAKERMEEHRRLFPGYVFKAGVAGSRTASSGTSSTRIPSDPFTFESSHGSNSPPADSAQSKPKAKRRVREIAPPDPVRNEQIASLLLAGVTGPELESRMKEFDKNHVREVQHRFEEIIVKPDAVKRKPSKPKLIIQTYPPSNVLPEPTAALPVQDPAIVPPALETKVEFTLDEFSSQLDFLGAEMDQSLSPYAPQVSPLESVSYFADPTQSYIPTPCGDTFDFDFLCAPNAVYMVDQGSFYQTPVSPCLFDFEQSYSPFQEQQYDIGFGLGAQISAGPNSVPMTTAFPF